MNLNWKDMMVVAGIVLVVTIISLAVYDGGKKMLAKKSTTPAPPKA